MFKGAIKVIWHTILPTGILNVVLCQYPPYWHCGYYPVTMVTYCSIRAIETIGVGIRSVPGTGALYSYNNSQCSVVDASPLKTICIFLHFVTL